MGFDVGLIWGSIWGSIWGFWQKTKGFWQKTWGSIPHSIPGFFGPDGLHGLYSRVFAKNAPSWSSAFCRFLAKQLGQRGAIDDDVHALA
jgi:hypothetical protein